MIPERKSRPDDNAPIDKELNLVLTVLVLGLELIADLCDDQGDECDRDRQQVGNPRTLQHNHEKVEECRCEVDEGANHDKLGEEEA
jgi:hypothetical protein